MKTVTDNTITNLSHSGDDVALGSSNLFQIPCFNELVKAIEVDVAECVEAA